MSVSTTCFTLSIFSIKWSFKYWIDSEKTFIAFILCPLPSSSINSLDIAFFRFKKREIISVHVQWPQIYSTCRKVKHFPVLSSLWLITGFVTRLTRRVSPVEQELLTLQEHLSWPPVFSGVRATRSLVLCVCFADRCLSVSTFFFLSLCCLFFDLQILITPFGIFNLFCQ